LQAPHDNDRFFSGFREPRWLALWAATAGLALDAMDVLFYSFALQTIRAEFGLSLSQAGLVTAATMLASAVGGIGVGILSDRIGRRKALIGTVLLFSLASGGSATAGGLASLLFWRAMVGLGLGGEWSAGAVLVAESWPARHRAKAIGFMQSGFAWGYMAASLVSAWVLPAYGWRTLFVIGMLPALLTFLIRRNVSETAIWKGGATKGARWTEIFAGDLGRKTVLATAVTTSVLIAYWGLFSWLPGFLAAPREAGGAGMTIVRSGLWIFTMQAGSLAGYLSFGFFADRWGRKPAFVFFVLGAAVVTPLYGLAPAMLDAAAAERLLFLLGPAVGFFGTGYFSLFGAMLAELFPTRVRGAGQGFAYNFGRAVSAGAPYSIGLAAERVGLGTALTANAGFFVLAALLTQLLPETRAVELE
jgi:MFS family permease